MEFNNFRANVALRALILVALTVVLAWSVGNTKWLATPFLCGAVMLLSAFELVRYVERTSRDLASFLTSVAHQDFSTPTAIPYKGRVFAELQAAYRVITGE